MRKLSSNKSLRNLLQAELHRRAPPGYCSSPRRREFGPSERSKLVGHGHSPQSRNPYPVQSLHPLGVDVPPNPSRVGKPRHMRCHPGPMSPDNNASGSMPWVKKFKASVTRHLVGEFSLGHPLKWKVPQTKKRPHTFLSASHNWRGTSRLFFALRPRITVSNPGNGVREIGES